MSEQVGYGSPPRSTRFKPGESGNPAGRPKKKPTEVEQLVQQFLDTPMPYRENGRSKSGTIREIAIKLRVEKAVKADIDAAELILTMRRHAAQHGETGIIRLIVTDWLPDFAGQTGEQKAQGLATAVQSEGSGYRRQDGQDQTGRTDARSSQDEGV